MEKNWIKIYSSTNAIKTELLKNLLINNNIHTICLNQQDSSYLMFGTVNLYVNKKDKNKALEILQNEP